MHHIEDDIWNDSGSENNNNNNGKNPRNSAASAMSSINSEFLGDIKQTFDRFDVKKDGKLKTQQLKFAMRALGFEPKKEEIKQITKEYDQNGFILLSDFITLMGKRLTEKSINEEIMKAFELFDRGKTGKITVADLKRVSEELDEEVSEQELKEMIEEADQDGDQAVNRQEFLRIMKNTRLY